MLVASDGWSSWRTIVTIRDKLRRLNAWDMILLHHNHWWAECVGAYVLELQFFLIFLVSVPFCYCYCSSNTKYFKMHQNLWGIVVVLLNNSSSGSGTMQSAMKLCGIRFYCSGNDAMWIRLASAHTGRGRKFVFLQFWWKICVWSEFKSCCIFQPCWFTFCREKWFFVQTIRFFGWSYKSH